MQRFKSARSFFSGITVWGFLLIAALAVFIFVSSFFDYQEQKKDLMELWRSQGDILTKTIIHSGGAILASDQQLERAMENRIADLGRYFRQLDSLNYSRHGRNRRMRGFGPVRDILFFDSDLRLEKPESFPRFIPDREAFVRQIRSELELRDSEYFAMPLKPGAPPGIDQAVIVRRLYNRGFIVIFPHSTPPGQHRRLLGIRNWVDQIVQNPTILYLHLSSGQRVVAHSGLLEPNQLPPLEAPEAGLSAWHLYVSGGNDIFEYIHQNPEGLTARIGLSTQQLEHLQAAQVQRFIYYSLFIFGMLAILSIYALKRQSLTLLQRKFREVQTFSSAVIDRMDEGVIVTDENRTIRTINQAALALLGLRENETIKSIDAISTVFSEEILHKIRNFQRMQDVPMERSYKGNNHHLLLSANAYPYTEQNEENLIYIVMIKDYTSRKELETLRRRRSKLVAMGNLASRVAHEIRNPLNGIGVLAQRIGKEYRPEIENREFDEMTRSIRMETARINDIIESFLSYARTPELKPETVPAASLIQNALPLLSSLCEEKSIHIKTGTLSESVVRVDRDQMNQVLINILKNAVEASTEGSVILVNASENDGWMILSIEDEGSGILEEIQEKIFDLYFTTKEKGSGLGLSIVEKIISAHGGKLQIESPYEKDSSVNNGTRVRIFLPQD